MLARLRLPSCSQNRTANLAGNVLIPFPRFWIDGFPQFQEYVGSFTGLTLHSCHLPASERAGWFARCKSCWPDACHTPARSGRHQDPQHIPQNSLHSYRPPAPDIKLSLSSLYLFRSPPTHRRLGRGRMRHHSSFSKFLTIVVQFIWRVSCDCLAHWSQSQRRYSKRGGGKLITYLSENKSEIDVM